MPEKTAITVNVAVISLSIKKEANLELRWRFSEFKK
jgi:hypothetical protein